jgi:hypothetical protein
MAHETVHIRGLREMNRAFKESDKNLPKLMRKKMSDVAKPVAIDAADRASRIGNVTGRWAEMRVGVTSRVVYVAPTQRGHRSSERRPNLASLLMDRAMQPALDAHSDDIVDKVGDALDELAREWGRHG